MHLLMQHFCYSVTGACNLSSTISIDEESFQALECWPHSQTFRNNAILRGLGDGPPITDGTQEQRKWWAGGCGDSWDRSDLHKPSFLPQLCLIFFIFLHLNRWIFLHIFWVFPLEQNTNAHKNYPQTEPVFYPCFPSSVSFFLFFHLTLIFGCPNHNNIGWRTQRPEASFFLCKDLLVTGCFL